MRPTWCTSDESSSISRRVSSQSAPRGSPQVLRIDGPGSEAERIDLLGRFLECSAPAQEGLDAGKQLGDRERLGDIVVGATAESLQDVLLGAPRGEDENREPRSRLAQLFAYVEAAHAR